MNLENLNINDFNYSLIKENIALYPEKNRDDSKLLIYNNGKIKSSIFSNILDFLPNETSIFFNNSRVINARFIFRTNKNAKIEILILNDDINNSFENKKKVEVDAIVGNAKKWDENEILRKKIENIVISARKKNNKILFSWDKNFKWEKILNICGKLPLPPYIKRNLKKSDYRKYQTIYSKKNGSIASPTAGLHFTEKLLEKIRNKHIVDFFTLHVGIGTFKPIKSKNLVKHKMHAEEIIISKKNINNIYNSKNITAVGTTSLRTLESVYYLGQIIEKGLGNFNIRQDIYMNNDNNIDKNYSCEKILDYMDKNNLDKIKFNSSIFIFPGYKFKICNQLITNFHFPKSTLILLIAAFIGEDWRKVYKFANDNKFRLLSYGDSSLLFRK